MTPCFDIELRDVHIYAHHGVFSQENTVGNEFVVNLSVRIKADESILATDDIDKSISYANLYDIVADRFSKPCRLLETVALAIAADIRRRWPLILSGQISIEKKCPPIPHFTGSAAVSLNF